MLLKSFTGKQGQTPKTSCIFRIYKEQKCAGREEQSKKMYHLNPVFVMHKCIFSSHNKELRLMAVMSGYSFFPAHRARAACPALFLYFFASSALKVALAPCRRSRLKIPCCKREVSNATSFLLSWLLYEAREWCRVHKDTFLIGALLKNWEQRLGAEKLCAVWTFLADL